jgi:replicative DNA helicase
MAQTGNSPPPSWAEQRYLEKPLPNSEESERMILGSVLLNNDLIAEAVGGLKPEDFYSPLNRKIFTAMTALFDASKRVDPILILEEMKKVGETESFGGIATIANLTFGLPRFAGIEDYIKLVKDNSDIRKLIRECGEISSAALVNDREVDNVLEEAETRIYNIRSETNAIASVPGAPGIGEALQAARDRKASGNAMVGVPSGFDAIDSFLQGFRPGQQIIVAARPSVGKTALAVKMLYHTTAREYVPAVLFSLEMAKEEIYDRIICAECDIDSYALRAGHLKREEWDAAEKVQQTLHAAPPFFINDSPFITTRTIRTELRRINAQLRKTGRQVGIIFVDHIGLVRNESEKRGRNREGEVSEISRNLKQIAREFGLAVVTLSQLNRQAENRSDHRPTLSDLRESGAIEQDADVVMLIYRGDLYQKEPSLYDNLAEVIIAKNRNGPTGLSKLHFTRRSARFVDLAHVVDNPEPTHDTGDILL